MREGITAATGEASKPAAVPAFLVDDGEPQVADP